MQNKRKILIGTSVFGKHTRQDLCINSLKKMTDNNSNLKCCLVQQKDDDVLYDDIKIYRNLERNSSNVFNAEKNIPFINDIFDVLAEECEDIFVFCNSDIVLTQTLFDYINSVDVEAFGISRTDILSVKTLSTDSDKVLKNLRIEPAGFDCWVVSKVWWKQNRHLFKDFVIGRPYFDVAFSIVMFLNSKNLFVNSKHLIFHVKHKSSWEGGKDKSYSFNEIQAKTHYVELWKIWDECCGSTFLKRPDWGKFLQIRSDEEQILRDIRDRYNKK